MLKQLIENFLLLVNKRIKKKLQLLFVDMLNKVKKYNDYYSMLQGHYYTKTVYTFMVSVNYLTPALSALNYFIFFITFMYKCKNSAYNDAFSTIEDEQDKADLGISPILRRKAIPGEDPDMYPICKAIYEEVGFDHVNYEFIEDIDNETTIRIEELIFDLCELEENEYPCYLFSTIEDEQDKADLRLSPILRRKAIPGEDPDMYPICKAIYEEVGFDHVNYEFTEYTEVEEGTSSYIEDYDDIHLSIEDEQDKADLGISSILRRKAIPGEDPDMYPICKAIYEEVGFDHVNYEFIEDIDNEITIRTEELIFDLCELEENDYPCYLFSTIEDEQDKADLGISSILRRKAIPGEDPDMYTICKAIYEEVGFDHVNYEFIEDIEVEEGTSYLEEEEDDDDIHLSIEDEQDKADLGISSILKRKDTPSEYTEFYSLYKIIYHELGFDYTNYEFLEDIEPNVIEEITQNFYSENNLDAFKLIIKFMKGALVYNDFEHIIYASAKTITDMLYYIKTTSYFKASKLIDLIVVDQLEEPRFKIIYNLLNLYKVKRFLVTTFIKDKTSLLSVNNIFSNSIWLEREAWDMFGLFFSKNKDLRRILTDYGFKGYPLRKDFPLSGYLELWYDDDAAYTMYEPIRLSQQLRFFNFTTLWEIN